MALLLTTACDVWGDECEEGQVRCHDNRAQVCEWGENGAGLRWEGNDCGAGSCRLPRAPDTRPFCTLEKEPDERCNNDDVATGFPSAFSFCDGNVVTACRDGFLDYFVDCNTGESGNFGSPLEARVGHCVTPSDRTFCAPEPEPNPLCDEKDGSGRACDGGDLLWCSEGYLMDRLPCEGGGTCVIGEIAECATERAAPGECDPTLQFFRFCRGNSALTCTYGFITDEQPCSAGLSCQPFGDVNVHCE